MKKKNRLSADENQAGQEIIWTQYEEVQSAGEKKWVKKEGKWGLVDQQQRQIAPIIYEKFVWWWCHGYKVRSEKGWGLLDRDGKQILPAKYEELYLRHTSLLAKSTGTWGGFDRLGHEIIPHHYEALEEWGDNVFIAKQGEKYGLINRHEQLITPFKYDKIRAFKAGKALVKLAGKWGLVDKNGQVVLEPQYDNIGLLMQQSRQKAPVTVKVMGIGGGCGCYTVSHMINAKVADIDYLMGSVDGNGLCARLLGIEEVDQQRLYSILLGYDLTTGIGVATIEEAREAALASKEEIIDALAGADIVFLVAGLGGPTGAGAMLVITEWAKSAGAATIGVVTLPWEFEGKKRIIRAEQSLAELQGNVDALIVIDMDDVAKTLAKHTGMIEAFRKVNEVVARNIKAILDQIPAQELTKSQTVELVKRIAAGGIVQG